VQLKKSAAISPPPAVAAEQKGGTKFRGIIIVRKDSGIEQVRDLKGKRLISVEKDSAADGIREDDLEEMADKIDLSQSKIVAFTDYYPNWPLFAASKLDKGRAEKIKAALLKLKPGNLQSEKSLAATKYCRFRVDHRQGMRPTSHGSASGRRDLIGP
jgi:ABC-type phosphate/phosphonate transport system substrate-binding protein